MTIRVRRPRYLFALIEDGVSIDPVQFFSGSIETSTCGQIKLISLLGGEPVIVDRVALELLERVPAQGWLDPTSLSDEYSFSATLLENLVQNGLLIADSNEAQITKMRERDALLTRFQWEPYAALHYVTSRWADRKDSTAQFPTSDEEFLDDMQQLGQNVEQLGPPPSHFHSIEEPVSELELPPAEADSTLRKLMKARQTIRYFDTSRQMTIKEISALLYFTFGCQGVNQISPEMVLLKKTSPSGGAMHPIEAYPLILNVEGLETGVYHYNVERHALSLIKALDRNAAEELVNNATAGQSYYKTAHMIVFLTARFYRHNWKYRRHEKAYKVVLMDAAHISQSFYLLCTEMKLGAFFTAALNDVLIEETLSLDFIEEGVVGAVGCGIRETTGFEFSFKTEPYVPGETDI